MAAYTVNGKNDLIANWGSGPAANLDLSTGNLGIVGNPGAAALASSGAAGENGTTVSLVTQSGGAGDGAGAAGAAGAIRLNAAAGAGGVFLKVPAPAASTTTGPTLTAAMLLNGLITSTQSGAVTATLDTGTAMDAAKPNDVGVDEGFDWSLINLGSSSGAVTVTASSGHSVVGLMVVAINTPAAFRTRRIGTNSWVTYRRG
jgi:hypothetical protein